MEEITGAFWKALAFSYAFWLEIYMWLL